MTRRGTVLALAGLLITAGFATQAAPPVILAAELAEPTGRYDHGVLGDAVEWGALSLLVEVATATGGTAPRRVLIRLPQTRVFEDVEARLADLDGDGQAEVLVVETDLARGASLAVYDAQGRRAATAFLGQPHRWLAPAGVGDLDGDGRPDIAYVDRPHLQRELVLLRLDGDRLTEIARLPGLTNHQIGDSAISGGLRDCGAGAELVLAKADWSALVALRWRGGQVEQTPLVGSASPAAFAAAMACRS